MMGGGEIGSTVDTRVLGKPSNFDGSPGSWKDWSFTRVGYCGAVSERLETLMREWSRKETGGLHADLDPEDRKWSLQLGYMLILSCKDKAIDRIRNFPDPQHGLESWRRLRFSCVAPQV